MIHDVPGVSRHKIVREILRRKKGPPIEELDAETNRLRLEDQLQEQKNNEIAQKMAKKELYDSKQLVNSAKKDLGKVENALKNAIIELKKAEEPSYINTKGEIEFHSIAEFSAYIQAKRKVDDLKKNVNGLQKKLAKEEQQNKANRDKYNALRNVYKK